VNNKRIEMRPVFRLENLCYCFAIERIGSEPVNSFGGERDDFASFQQFNRRGSVG
jgi:hypothetical protein